MFGYGLADIPGNDISNLELRQSGEPLPSQRVLPSATTRNHFCQWQYALIVYTTEKQLPS